MTKNDLPTKEINIKLMIFVTDVSDNNSGNYLCKKNSRNDFP